jgi:hypothetical protein
MNESLQSPFADPSMSLLSGEPHRVLRHMRGVGERALRVVLSLALRLISEG